MKNKKNKKVMMAFLAILVLAAVITVVIRRKDKDDDSDGGSAGGYEGGSSGDTEGGSVSLPSAMFPLTPYSKAGEYSAIKGSYGQQIANLQKICNSKFGDNLSVDGKFGPNSEKAFAKRFLLLPPYGKTTYDSLISIQGSGIVF